MEIEPPGFTVLVLVGVAVGVEVGGVPVTVGVEVVVGVVVVVAVAVLVAVLVAVEVSVGVGVGVSVWVGVAVRVGVMMEPSVGVEVAVSVRSKVCLMRKLSPWSDKAALLRVGFTPWASEVVTEARRIPPKIPTLRIIRNTLAYTFRFFFDPADSLSI